MAYSTPAMVRQALVPSSDGSLPTTPTNTAADLTDTQLSDAIAEADSLIDGYIGAYYAVPVVPLQGQTLPPHPIDYFSRNLASYNATLTYREGLDFADTDPVARRYTNTIAVLTKISTGIVRLQLPQNLTENAATGASAPYNPYVGDLFDPMDFSLRPASFDPTWGPNPYWYDAWWMR